MFRVSILLEDSNVIIFLFLFYFVLSISIYRLDMGELLTYTAIMGNRSSTVRTCIFIRHLISTLRDKTPWGGIIFT